MACFLDWVCLKRLDWRSFMSMRVIGITGGFGSGKTTVAGIIGDLGIPVIDADKIGHRLLDNDLKLRRILFDRFGDSIKNSEGNIDRARLAETVFNNPAELAFLNGVTHPRIHQETVRQLEYYKNTGQPVVILDAPLLIEADWSDLVDEIWLTLAPKKVIIERMRNKGIPVQEVETRMRAQMNDAQKRKYAHRLIETDTDLDILKSTVVENFNEFKVKNVLT